LGEAQLSELNADPDAIADIAEKIKLEARAVSIRILNFDQGTEATSNQLEDGTRVLTLLMKFMQLLDCRFSLD
jgi:hypothetical protein